MQGLRVRRSWRPNRNCNILTLTLMAVSVVSFSFSWCSTGGPGAHSAGWWTTSYQQLLWTPTHQGLKAPSAWCGFNYHISSTSSPTRTGTWTQLLSWLSYIIVQRPLNRLLDLWNGMIDHHQTEITVMQFTGHSLPVHQSMSVPWEFFFTSSHFISQFLPTLFPLITAIRMCHFLPVHHSEWHFWPGRRSKCHSLTWIVFVMGGWWPYSWCLVGCCRPDLFNIARSIPV